MSRNPIAASIERTLIGQRIGNWANLKGVRNRFLPLPRYIHSMTLAFPAFPTNAGSRRFLLLLKRALF